MSVGHNARVFRGPCYGMTLRNGTLCTQNNTLSNTFGMEKPSSLLKTGAEKRQRDRSDVPSVGTTSVGGLEYLGKKSCNANKIV